LIANIDENAENNNKNTILEQEPVIVLRQPETQQSQIQNTDDSSSSSSSSSSIIHINTVVNQHVAQPAQANFKAYMPLPPLNENKPARKRIYTHNKVNSLLHSNLTIIKAKTLTANPVGESIGAGVKVAKAKKATKSNFMK
jgi:hypothetical protein